MLSDEHKKKISESLKGIKRTEATRKLMSETQMGRQLSEETKEKIRQKALERGATGLPSATRKDHSVVNGVEMKCCVKCLQTKTLSEFPKNKRRWDGLHTYCKLCHATKKRDYYNQNDNVRKKGLLKRIEDRRSVKLQAIYYLGGKCKHCNYQVVEDENEAAFDFHHTDPTQKDMAIGSMTVLAFKNILNELTKCILLCRVCHAKHHQKEWRERHGINKKAP